MLVTAGCSSARKGGPFAGLNEYDAGQAGQSILDQETAPDGELHGKELAVAGMTKGAVPSSHRPAWVIRLENFDHVHFPLCLYLWGRFTPFQGSKVTYAIDACPDSGST